MGIHAAWPDFGVGQTAGRAAGSACAKQIISRVMSLAFDDAFGIMPAIAKNADFLIEALPTLAEIEPRRRQGRQEF
jgi:hypothetical protein